MSKKIIMLATASDSTNILFNGIKDVFPISKVLIEDKISRKKFLKRRAKKLGYTQVFGQVLFQLLIPPKLRRNSVDRIEEIKQQFDLNEESIPTTMLHHVGSVNSAKCIEYLQKEKPDLVIVNGTRIISKKVLNCTHATFVNTHAGITPKYRGVHGAYWAMANRDAENCGVTIHLVDSGIDTGGILYQKNISPIQKDNFITYTYLQMGEGLELMKQTIRDFSNNEIKTIKARTSESNLFYHPTLWSYLNNKA